MVISHIEQQGGIDHLEKASYQTKGQNSHAYLPYLVGLREILRFDPDLVMNRRVVHEQLLVPAYGMCRQNAPRPIYPLYIPHPWAMTPYQ